ncbi:MAG: hypothetical protein CMJ64_28395 [Planctomycetaceae bacterium]|nr:hypothetical protein [Planctomycetaceae bacterium]
MNRLLSEEAVAEPGQTVPRADDETFLRRVFFDLVGEAPTPEDEQELPQLSSRFKLLDGRCNCVG